MVFVNTSLDVALERNATRTRTVPKDITIKSWNAVQNNIGRFQNMFGSGQMIIVDNNNAKEDTLNKVYSKVRNYVRAPIKSYVAKRWIENELKKKRLGIKEDVNDMTHPKTEPKPVNNVVGDWKNIDVPKPSLNDIEETKSEMMMMSKLFEQRNNAILQSIKDHDQEVFYGIESYLMKYNLEYGKSSLSIQKEALEKFNSYAIVDDLLATGGTIKCVDNLIKKSGKEVYGCITVIELLDLKGREELEFNVESILKI